jgi:glucose-1-phosphate thymidylyltransferase
VNLAIIDATGVGGANGPDCIVGCRYATPIANLPLIAHVLDELAQSGILRARLIAPDSVCKEIGQILGDANPRGVDISYLEAPETGGRAVVLAEIAETLETEAVLLHPGDCLFRSQVADMRGRFCAGDVDSVLPEQASVVALRDPTERRASDTVLALGPGTREIVYGLLSPDGDGDGDDLIESLLKGDCRLAVCAQTEHWCYSDSTKSLLEANRMMLDSLVQDPAPEHFGGSNEIDGRVAISPSAYLSNCIVHGPVSIGERAVLEDSFIGPYTAIGPDVVVNGAEIDNSMLLAGAEVNHAGFRIEGSIIGEQSRVTRSFELPKGLHLRLSAQSRVSLS